MWKTLCVWLMLACVLPIAWAKQKKCPESGTPGDYSQQSVELCYQDWKTKQRHLAIASPDHSVMLVVEGETARLQVKGVPAGEPFEVTPDEEWIWSPDSRAVVVTQILGSSGPSGARVMIVDSNQSIPDVAEGVERDFAARHANLPCAQEPNTAGLTWLYDSTKLVLVAEVPPSPRCEKADGYFEAYVVSIPEGKILRRYSMKETITRFRKVMGPSLLSDIQAQKDEHGDNK
jgi:hypothetical protein